MPVAGLLLIYQDWNGFESIVDSLEEISSINSCSLDSRVRKPSRKISPADIVISYCYGEFTSGPARLRSCILHYLYRTALDGDLTPLRRYCEEGSVKHISYAVGAPRLSDYDLEDPLSSNDNKQSVENNQIKVQVDSDSRDGYHISQIQCKIVSSRISNLGKRLLADFKKPVKVAQWRICIALGFGQRRRVPSSVEIAFRCLHCFRNRFI